MKKKIIFVIGLSELGGTELQTLKLCQNIAVINPRIELWILSGKGIINEINKTTLVVRNIPIANEKPFRKILNFYKLVQFVRKEENVIFHTQLPMASILVFIANRFRKTRQTQVVGVRGRISDRGLIKELILRKCFRAAEKIICNSEHLAHDVKERFLIPQSKLITIHNGVDTPNKYAKQKNKKLSAVVLANFIPYKGHTRLLEAIPKLKNKISFTFYGQGVLKESLTEKVKEMGLEKTVLFAESKSESKDFLADYQMGIHPSETEGLSNAILEEISHGLPVIALNIGGNHLLVKNHENGLLLNEFNPESLAKAIDSLSGDEKVRTKMGQKSIEIAQDYNWKNCVERHMKCYESL